MIYTIIINQFSYIDPMIGNVWQQYNHIYTVLSVSLRIQSEAD